MNSLPLELTDAIVDVLSDDHRSICTLLSVPRCLRSRARVHSFRIVHLPSEDSVLVFNDLCHSSPGIPHLVKELYVVLPRTTEHTDELHQLLESHPFPNVRALTLKNTFRHGNITKEVPSAFLSYPLASLTLDIRLFRLESLYELLMCYTTLKHLDISLVDVMWTRKGEVHQGTILSIEDFSISGSALPLCSAVQLFKVNTLRSVTLAGFKVPELHKCQQLLKNPSGALQRLHIYQPRHWYAPQIELEMLHVPFLTLEACRYDFNAGMGVKWFADCLKSGIGPVKVSGINILLTPSGELHGSLFESPVDKYIWSSLDSTLMTPRFAATTLRIWVGYVLEWYPTTPDADFLEQTQLFICSALPGLHSENRLEDRCKML
ncbi:hypothetical protein ARMGADRAFT_827442 [Armillaria gallica]|uniref:F-box domain-containing protein n=1 Tax=Armillaria gallica TaxID=47427 RepID=A0A2H3CC33_ARMGA|nr:hypothetical protein ARMGADRAFT_827442 [Armillaria gallica]